MPGYMTRALRGATTVTENTKEAIASGATELVRAIMQSNELEPVDMVSIIFTTTGDLNAEFPAVGARRLGLTQVPLLCATEIAVPGSLERVIRCLVHVNTTRRPDELRHVYLHEARRLRPDLV